MKYTLALICLILFCTHRLHAQGGDQKKKNKDFFNIKAPSIEYSTPDTSEILFEEEIGDESEAPAIYFDPRKELEMISEDTSMEEEGELSIVETEEQMNVDSIWVTIAQYYSIWDSRSINPYKIDGTQFNDTIPLTLYDTLTGLNWALPLEITASTSRFGMRPPRWHYGTDLKLNIGDPVMAAFDGIVRINQFDRGGYGNYVLVRHYNGLETLYGHLSKSEVKVGQLVKAGERLGLGGNTGRSTGPHLHFEVRYEGNAIDPEHIYDFRNGTLRAKVFNLMPEHFEYLKKSARKVYYHTVRSGESISSISRKYRVSVSTLCKLNRITTRTTLKAGRKIRIR